MKIHCSNEITNALLQKAANLCGPRVFLAELKHFGSRTHEQRIDVGLASYTKGRRRNMQHIKNDPEGWYAATYDEWGWFLVQLFNVDPNLRTERYDGVQDFHAKTECRFLLDTIEAVDRFLESAR